MNPAAVRPNRLEQRYRALLRLLPAGYRRIWAEEMVAAYLASVATDDPDDADYLADYGRPSWAETASVLALAVRLRFGTAGNPPRYQAWAQAIRLAALAALLPYAAGALVGVGMRLWLTGSVPPAVAPPAGWTAEFPTGLAFRLSDIAELGSLAAFLLVLLGHRPVGRVAAGLALLPVIATAALRLTAREMPPPDLTTVAYLAFGVLLALSLLAYHRDAAPVHPRPWLAALPVAVLLVLGAVLVSSIDPQAPPVLDWPGFLGLAVAVAGAVHLLRRTGSADWTHALTLLAGAAAGMRLVSLADYALHDAFPTRPLLIGVGLAELAAVLAVGVPLAVRTARELRRLPKTPAGSVAWTAPRAEA